jgi:flagellar hook assembly protein FlgD
MLSRIFSFRAAVAVLFFTAFTACSDDKKEDPKPAETQGMSWTVDAANATASTSTAQAVGTELYVSGTTGTGSTGSTLLLSMPKAVGTYAITATSDAGALYQLGTSGSAASTYEASTGSIVVTTYTPSTTPGASNIAGTFTFTASNGSASKTLTNGKFNVKF